MTTQPKSAKDTVYIDAEDDITAIIDKIEGAKNSVVALVLPKRTPALQSIVNMKLLKRSAKKADKNVVLITSEQALLPLAGTAGVHVSKSLSSKPEIPAAPLAAAAVVAAAKPRENVSEEKLDGNQAIGDLATAHDGQEAVELGDGDEENEAKPEKSKPAKDKKLKVPNFERFRVLTIAAIVGGIALIVLFILGMFVWPQAKIIIHTESSPVAATFSMNATDKAKALDEIAGTIPSTLKTSDQTGSSQQNASGQQNNGTKATGSVTMNAGTCGPNFPSDVSAGTGVSTNGLTYITQAKASFSAQNSGGHCFFVSNSVGITAQQGGAKYNTGISGATVAGNSGVSASGSASGGTDNNITVVSQADVDAAKQKAISPQSAADFTKNFEKQLSEQGFYVISSTMKANDPQVTANPGVGQPASSTTVNVKITYSVLVVQKSDLAKAIKDQLNKQIDTTKQKISSSDVLKDATVTVQSSSSPSQATIQISITTTAVPTLNVAIIKKQAGGKKKGDIQNFISDYPGVKSVSVKFSPFWVSKAPKKPAKVQIVLVQDKSDS